MEVETVEGAGGAGRGGGVRIGRGWVRERGMQGHGCGLSVSGSGGGGAGAGVRVVRVAPRVRRAHDIVREELPEQPEQHEHQEQAHRVRDLRREELLEEGAEQQAERHEEDVPLQRRLVVRLLLPLRVRRVVRVGGARLQEVLGPPIGADLVAARQDRLVRSKVFLQLRVGLLLAPQLLLERGGEKAAAAVRAIALARAAAYTRATARATARASGSGRGRPEPEGGSQQPPQTRLPHAHSKTEVLFRLAAFASLFDDEKVSNKANTEGVNLKGTAQSPHRTWEWILNVAMPPTAAWTLREEQINPAFLVII